MKGHLLSLTVCKRAPIAYERAHIVYKRAHILYKGQLLPMKRHLLSISYTSNWQANKLFHQATLAFWVFREVIVPIPKIHTRFLL